MHEKSLKCLTEKSFLSYEGRNFKKKCARRLRVKVLLLATVKKAGIDSFCNEALRVKMCKFGSVFIGFLCGISGCASVAPTDTAPIAQRVTKPSSESLKTGVQTDPVSVPPMIQWLLSEAELALREHRYFSPSHSNAYDHFAAIKMLDPDGEEWKTGKDRLLRQSVQSVKHLLEEKNVSTARQLRKNIELAYKGDPRLSVMVPWFETFAAPPVRNVNATLHTGVKAVSEFVLQDEHFQSLGDKINPDLVGIANEIQQKNASILIYARNDAEGRWLYRQLKKASPGYRVRGDIRVSGQAKIVIYPPLD